MRMYPQPNGQHTHKRTHTPTHARSWWSTDTVHIAFLVAGMHKKHFVVWWKSIYGIFVAKIQTSSRLGYNLGSTLLAGTRYKLWQTGPLLCGKCKLAENASWHFPPICQSMKVFAKCFAAVEVMRRCQIEVQFERIGGSKQKVVFQGWNWHFLH